MNKRYDLSIDIFDNNVEKYQAMLKDLYQYLLEYIKKHPNIPFIMEGIQIYADDAFKNISNKDSVIIIRTSMVKSMRKVMDRPHCEIRNHLHTYIDFQQKLRDFERRFNTDQVKIATEAATSELSFNTPQELSKWMMRNIKYRNFTKLKSWDEVLRDKSGSCHDQVIFALHFLREMEIYANAEFLCEYDDGGQGGTTHSFVYYKIDGKYYWFENAWNGQQGIHEFNSFAELKEYFKNTHENKEWGDCDRFPNIEFSSFKYHIGDNLQTLMNRTFK
jgi:hypothetical protein